MIVKAGNLTMVPFISDTPNQAHMVEKTIFMTGTMCMNVPCANDDKFKDIEDSEPITKNKINPFTIIK